MTGNINSLYICKKKVWANFAEKLLLKISFTKNKYVSKPCTVHSKKASGSRITLANPDPSAGENEDFIIRSKRSSVFSESDSVSFIPADINVEGSGTDEDREKVLGTVETVTLNFKEEENTEHENTIKDELWNNLKNKLSY